ncbi:MAG: alpha/beta fold hydrolase [Candidatus Omnitrophota bacterium]
MHINQGAKVKRYGTFICTAGLLFTALFFAHESEAIEFEFKDPQYSFQTLRAISQSVNAGADIRECIDTARRIKEGDDESWYREWFKTARRIEEAGDKFLTEGRKVSAQEAYLRASNYYRSAEFFLHANPKDKRIIATWRKSRDCFLKFAKLTDGLVTPVEIPFEKTTLAGYLCLVDKRGARRPLVIVHSGFDGTAEEEYITHGVALVKRGYNCLIFEGPGQGRVLREQKIYFRPDWETVVTPVVDYALKLKEADSDSIALMGISFGGYLAPRAVAFEHRIKACIANGGIYDFHEVVVRNSPADIEEILDNKEESKELDKEIYEEMRTNSGLRWVFNDGMWKFQAKSPSGWMRKTRPYNLKDCADKITCRMLVVDSEADRDTPGEAKKLYDALRCPKDLMLFTVEEGAGEHCQIGAFMISNERIINWLDGVFRK